MREHKFRGKRTDNGEWVFGAYMPATKQHDTTIGVYQEGSEYQPGWWEWYEVDPGTVGEYTGLPDESGMEICEEDIVVDGDNYYSVVIWSIEYAGWFIQTDDGPEPLWEWANRVTIASNIYDNPELLKESD